MLNAYCCWTNPNVARNSQKNMKLDWLLLLAVPARVLFHWQQPIGTFPQRAQNCVVWINETQNYFYATLLTLFDLLPC